MVVTAAIYTLSTGLITRTMTCPHGWLLAQVQEGEEFFLNCPDWATHIIDNEPVKVEPPPPPPPTLDEARAAKEQAIRTEGNRRLNTLARPYQPAERETWATQLAEAEAWTADNAAPTPMVDQIAAARGVGKATLVGLILGNANLFRAESGRILGQQQAILDRLWASQTVEEITTIAWAEQSPV